MEKDKISTKIKIDLWFFFLPVKHKNIFEEDFPKKNK